MEIDIQGTINSLVKYLLELNYFNTFLFEYHLIKTIFTNIFCRF